MSLGAFLTDESKISQSRQPAQYIRANYLQRWVHGLMRWRICQFVSNYTLSTVVDFTDICLSAGVLPNPRGLSRILGTDLARLPYRIRI